METRNLSYHGAQVAHEERRDDIDSVAISECTRPLPVGNGGGKDSLVMIRMLDRRDVAFDTFSINFHTEADPARQLTLNECILTNLRPFQISARRRIEHEFGFVEALHVHRDPG